jgi:CRISPR system Cascade subunit CasE
MYLSKLVFNARNRQVLRDLGDAHKMHQRIMHAFPDDVEGRSPREDWHILFRHERDSDVVLVQSAIEPDWSMLPSGYLSHIQTKPLNLDVGICPVGRVFQFRLRANPSKRDNQTRKTVGFYRRADQLAWLERQGDRCGFRLHGVDVIPSPNVFGRKQGNPGPIRITTALYQGVLEVVDPDRLVSAIGQGIGRGKSYGCGLLSLAPIRG